MTMDHPICFEGNRCGIVNREEYNGLYVRFLDGEDALVPSGLEVNVCRACDKSRYVKKLLIKMGYKVKLSICNTCAQKP